MLHSIVSITHDLFVGHLSNVARLQQLFVPKNEEYQCQIVWQAWCLAYRQQAWAPLV
jgi:hypothetical protein